MDFPFFTESRDSVWCTLESATVPYSTSPEPRPHGAPLTTKISSNTILAILFASMMFSLPCVFCNVLRIYNLNHIPTSSSDKTWSFHLLWHRVEQLKCQGDAPENWRLHIGVSSKHGWKDECARLRRGWVFSNVWQNCSCFMFRTGKKNVGNWRVSCVESNSSLASEVWEWGFV